MATVILVSKWLLDYIISSEDFVRLLEEQIARGMVVIPVVVDQLRVEKNAIARLGLLRVPEGQFATVAKAVVGDIAHQLALRMLKIPPVQA